MGCWVQGRGQGDWGETSVGLCSPQTALPSDSSLAHVGQFSELSPQVAGEPLPASSFPLGFGRWGTRSSHSEKRGHPTCASSWKNHSFPEMFISHPFC